MILAITEEMLAEGTAMFGYKLPLDGKDIMELKGLAPGPAVKECQEYLLKVAMSHKNITREEVIKQLMGYKPKKK